MSLTYAEAVEVIAQRWAEVWEALDPDVPYGLPNDGFTPPTDGTPYALLAINEEVSTQSNLAPRGQKRMKRQGRVLIKLATTADRGITEGVSNGPQSCDYVKTARDVFEAQSFDGVDFVAVSSRPAGTDGRYLFTIVDAPFTYYETV